MTGWAFVISVLAVGGNAAPVDFDSEVMPVLTKAGCNAGACHGAAAGRGGLQLSLYGSDPAADYDALVRNWGGRRVNLAQPWQSLIILKPTEQIEHGGGTRLGGEGAEILRLWIEQGARRVKSRHLSAFHIVPESHVVVKEPMVSLSASARFSDGSVKDVTTWTVWTAEDPSSVQVEANTATLTRRGRHLLIARYLDQVVPVELIWPFETALTTSTEAASSFNFIDTHIAQRLGTLGLPTAPMADDATFIRRLYLDLVGRLPTPDQLSQYLEDTSDDKRRKQIDQLLASHEFIEYWAFRLSRLLRIQSQPADAIGAERYYTWLCQQLKSGTPYDTLARELLLATGDTHEIGPANFYRAAAGPREQAEFTSELFMGARLRCANCHDHPLDQWTQDDYHGLAAIFARLDRNRVVSLTDRGVVTHPRTGEPAALRIPGDRFLNSTADPREAFANWLTDANNPYFAKAIVNRLWKAMMGRGLVEPTDDLRTTNPPTHPGLLDQLTEDFVRHNYDLRHVLRRIANSATYGRSPQVVLETEADDHFYSHALTRPLEPEVLADALSDVLGIGPSYGELPAGTRAIEIYDARVNPPSLTILGRCELGASCESIGDQGGNLSRTLHLFNGPLINGRLTARDGWLREQIDGGKSSIQIVGDAYLRALCRTPTPAEREFWNRQLNQADTDVARQQLLEDFLWSLLASREFVTNH